MLSPEVSPGEIASDDWGLVQAYVLNGSEKAFRALVERHVAMVYGVCQRQLRDSHMAEDVTQAVFVILARRAASLREGVILGAWLHRTAVYCCANSRQLKKTREFHEQRVRPMKSQPMEIPDTAEWAEIEALLDEGILGLSHTQRDALVLRFFENQSLPQIARRLNLTAYAADKQLKTALARLRRFLARRGLTVSAALLTVGLAAQTTRAAASVPSGLAAATSAAAVSPGTISATVGMIVARGLRRTAVRKLQAALIAGCVVLFITSVALAVTMNMKNGGAGGGMGRGAGVGPGGSGTGATEKDLAPFYDLLHKANVALRNADTEALRACCVVDDAPQWERWAAMARVFQAGADVRAAMTERFGAAARGTVGIEGLGARLDDSVNRIAPESVQWEVGDTVAAIHFAYRSGEAGMAGAGQARDAAGGSIYFRRMDGAAGTGAWRIDATRTARAVIAATTAEGNVVDVAALPATARTAALGRMAEMADRLTQVAAGIRGGTFADAAAAETALVQAGAPRADGPRVFYRLELRLDEQGTERMPAE